MQWITMQLLSALSNWYVHLTYTTWKRIVLKSTSMAMGGSSLERSEIRFDLKRGIKYSFWNGDILLQVGDVGCVICNSAVHVHSPILKLSEWMHIIVNRCKSQLLINFLFTLYTCILFLFRFSLLGLPMNTQTFLIDWIQWSSKSLLRRADKFITDWF